MRCSVSRSAAAWAGLAGLLLAGTLPASAFPADALDWQAARAWREPWRDWTAAFVHLSHLHLAANAAGAVLVGAFGLAAAVPWRSVVAWLLAWPLAQLGLIACPELLRYAGLSGVLHAGVACAALFLAANDRGGRRWVGVATLAGLVAKVVSEAPWGAALRHPAGWDIAVAPCAHASGLLAGLATAALAEAWHRRPRRRPAQSRPRPRIAG